jgi:hypothetical protein
MPSFKGYSKSSGYKASKADITGKKKEVAKKMKVGSDAHYKAWKKKVSGPKALKKASDRLKKHQENN